MSLRELQADPAAFQDAIHVVTDAGSFRFGSVMADFQRERFAAVNPSLVAVANGQTPPVPRLWDERTKGASKDSDWAVNLLWLLMFSRRMLRIQVGAFDSDQADEVRQIIRSILRCDAPLNRAVASVVKVQASKIINTRTESVCEILTRDSLGGHGARPNVLLLNELSHVNDKEFAETLLDNADKMPNGLVVIATNAGFVPSWQADWKAVALSSERWRVMEYAKPSPWISEAALEESRKRNSAARFNRLWKGIWAANGGDALEDADVASSVTLAGPTIGHETGYRYAAGVDLGISNDASAVVIVGKHCGWAERRPIIRPERPMSPAHAAMADLGYIERQPDPPSHEMIHHEGTGRLKVCRVKVWKPRSGERVSVEAVEQYIADAHNRFGLDIVGADPWQAEYLIQRLRKQGVEIESVPFTPANLTAMAAAVLDAFNNHRIDLFDDERLLTDIRQLRLVEKSYGTRLDSPRGPSGHGDSATGLAVALLAARKLAGPVCRTVARELVCYP